MSYIDRYRRRINLNGTTQQERIINNKIKEFDNYIKNTPNRFEVLIDSNVEKYLIALQDVTLNNKYGDEKYVVTYNETPMNVGSIFSCMNIDWIVIEEENNSIPDHQTFKIRPCNYTLKHLNSNNKLISTPCIATNATMYSLGVEENKEVKMPDGKLSIQIPYNDDTKEITRDKRFIFHKFPYQVTFLDYAQVDNKNHIGLIGLILQETEKLDQDDIVNQIAYNGEINISLEVTPMDINLTLLDTIQLSAVIKYNDAIVNKETIWTSNDELIATIDELGNISPISEGICQIRCELKDNPNIYQLVNVNVANIISDNYEVVITGDNEIREFESKEYTAKLLNNGVEIPTQFDFIIDYLGNDSKIAELIVIDDNTCKIQANSQSIYGYVKLIVTDKNNINNIAELDIKIRSLW